MNKIDILYQKWQSLQPLPERKQYLLSQRFTVDYNYNSNHIEGNTLTYGQTELLFANSTSKCKITKCFCKSTPLVLRNSIFFLVSH